MPRDLADPRRKRIRVRRSSAVSMRFRGVCWDKRGKKWRVRITVGSKTKHIGRFIDKIEAARAYDAYAIANGIDAPRNFREDDVDAGAARGGGRFFDQQSQRWLAVRVTVGGKRDLASRITTEEENAARASRRPDEAKGIGAFTDEVDEANDDIVNDIDTALGFSDGVTSSNADFEVALLLNLFNGDAVTTAASESSLSGSPPLNIVAAELPMSAAAVEAEAAASAAPLWRMCEHDVGFHRYALCFSSARGGPNCCAA